MLDDPEVLMEIRGLLLDPGTKTPIVVLRDPTRDLFLPIWIGVFEANAIAMRLEGLEPPRPMTHDLLSSLLATLGGRLERVVVTALLDSTFFARVHIAPEAGEVLALDARPSDALALALRAEAPIYVLQSVLEAAEAVELLHSGSDEDRLKEWLENIDPEELGKYEM
jgi:bifunctional DNase/RNase